MPGAGSFEVENWDRKHGLNNLDHSIENGTSYVTCFEEPLHVANGLFTVAVLSSMVFTLPCIWTSLLSE